VILRSPKSTSKVWIIQLTSNLVRDRPDWFSGRIQPAYLRLELTG
jgi:hypothetical protein